MEKTFILSCESTVDLPYSHIEERGMSLIFYTYAVAGEEYVDDMGRDPKALPQFYEFMKGENLPTTSQINYYRYYDYFKGLLEKGDVLHLAFSSGLTPSANNAKSAAEDLKKEFPDRKIIVIDTLCASSGYGLIVDLAADKWDSGCSIEELAQWAEEFCHNVHHHFFVSDLKHLRRSGRVSGVAATAAAVLGICPLLHLNKDGKIIAHSKVRGKKGAINATVQKMLSHAVDGKNYSGKCYISNANCYEDAEQTKQCILEAFPNVECVNIYNIGTIIASHCGPGTVAVFFMGDKRSE